MTILRSSILVGSFFGLCGCAVVRMVDADGSELVTLQPFAYRPEAIIRSPVLVSQAAIGVAQTPLGTTIGLQSADIVLIPPDCHAIIIVDTARALAARRLAHIVEEKCMIEKSD